MAYSLLLLATLAWVAEAQFELFSPNNPTQLLGESSPYFKGPNVFDIASKTPAGCTVDMAGFVSRHGSRYPDPSAYLQWTSLAKHIHSSTFAAEEPFGFLSTWEPVLTDPKAQMSELSIGGWTELGAMGIEYRRRYPQLYGWNQTFSAFANQYPASPRVIDSARLFTRSFLGPNATTLGSIYVLNSTDPRGAGNNLAPSDQCKTFSDDSDQETTWNDLYIPSITARINKLITGDLQFMDNETEIMPYLCGFETQITGIQSPWCNVFTEAELRQYEYAQDLYYYYGSGPGSGKNQTMMLPVLNALIERFVDGPNTTYTNSNGSSWTPPPLIAMFTNDGEINELASEIGVFDDQAPLPPTYLPWDQLYIASHYVCMKGTIAFERLNCGGGLYMRILLNDVVYPVPSCQSGPGRSCPLKDYQTMIAEKTKAAGNFAETCDLNTSTVVTETLTATFLKDNALPWEYVVSPGS